jgi:probable rRNA maturation factor
MRNAQYEHMIIYEPTGRVPSPITSELLGRIGKACALTRAKAKRGRWSVGLRFASRSEIRSLNRAYRGKNRPTDVLSFGADGDRRFPGHDSVRELGDVIVCAAEARKNAASRAADPAEELVRLVVHGTLHLLGYDHADARSRARMFDLQERIVRSSGFGVRDSGFGAMERSSPKPEHRNPNTEP